MVSYAVLRFINNVPILSFTWNPFSMRVVKVRNCSSQTLTESFNDVQSKEMGMWFSGSLRFLPGFVMVIMDVCFHKVGIFPCFTIFEINIASQFRTLSPRLIINSGSKLTGPSTFPLLQLPHWFLQCLALPIFDLLITLFINFNFCPLKMILATWVDSNFAFVLVKISAAPSFLSTKHFLLNFPKSMS